MHDLSKYLQLQKSIKRMDDTQSLIVSIVGWIYFAAWSISFYGQIYINFKIKSVEGMNFDFVAMNLTGFLLYSVYNTYGYFVDSTQTGKVDLNDIIFAYHALFATCITIIQIIIYPARNNRIHLYTIVFLIIVWIFCMIYATITVRWQIFTPDSKLGVISIMGYIKLAISTLKYLPQFYWNYQRKSTKGWSIFNILMDLTGGLFSFGQMGLELLFGQDVDINIVKTVLGVMVVLYDIVFIFQHYCLYGDKQPEGVNNNSSLYSKLQTEKQINSDRQNATV